MKHIIFCLTIALSLMPFNGYCETMEIIAEGEYVMGAGETMAIAEERALKKAEQNAAEQAGAYVKSYTKVKNLMLSEDVIEVIANHAMKISVLDKRKFAVGDLDAIKFQVKIKAVMTTEEVETNLKKVRNDSSIVETYNKLKTEFERQSKEIEMLKKKLTETAGEEKKQVLSRITDEEKIFKANLWLEKAGNEISNEMTLKAYDKAIELNPSLVEAYVGRARTYVFQNVNTCYQLLEKGQGECAEQLEYLKMALSDVNKAISLDKNHAGAYAQRANVYNSIKGIELSVAYAKKEDYSVTKAIEQRYAQLILSDINTAISLKPDNHIFYEQRSGYFDPVNETDRVLSDITRAIVLCREANCHNLFFYLKRRADFYLVAGKEDLAKKDKAESEKIFSEENKKNMDIGKQMQNSELVRLSAELFPHAAELDFDGKRKEQRLKALNKKISLKKGAAEDYIARADLGINSKERRLLDYAEGIRLLKKRKVESKNDLLMTKVLMFKAMLYYGDKEYDPALNELKEAFAIIERRLPRALLLLKPDDFWSIVAGTQEAQDMVMKMSREEAEAIFWIQFASEVINERARIYEELEMPAKAGAEYRHLCEKLKEKQACKNAERLK